STNKEATSVVIMSLVWSFLPWNALLTWIIGVYNRLSSEWDALSDMVKIKLRNDLIVSIEMRLKSEGRVKGASEWPFNNQQLVENDFLLWRPPILCDLDRTLESDGDDRSLHMTSSPQLSLL